MNNNLKTFDGLNVDDAINSLLSKSSALLTYSLVEWDSYFVKHVGGIDRFVIYLPQVPMMGYREIPLYGMASGGVKRKIDLKLAFEPKGRGRLTGLGIGLKGNREAQQIWRMDYHPHHEDSNTQKTAAYFIDYPYHYHVRNAPNR